MAYAFGTPGRECIKQDLSVRLRAKAIAFRLEAAPQFSKIVDLTIEGQYIAVVGVHHRLVAARGEIDDAEAIVPECNAGIFVNMSSRIVRAAMADCFQHALKISDPTREDLREATRQCRT